MEIAQNQKLIILPPFLCKDSSILVENYFTTVTSSFEKQWLGSI